MSVTAGAHSASPAGHGQELLLTAGVVLWAGLVLDLCLGRAPGTSSFPKAPFQFSRAAQGCSKPVVLENSSWGLNWGVTVSLCPRWTLPPSTSKQL